MRLGCEYSPEEGEGAFDEYNLKILVIRREVHCFRSHWRNQFNDSRVSN